MTLPIIKQTGLPNIPESHFPHFIIALKTVQSIKSVPCISPLAPKKMSAVQSCSYLHLMI